jgi:release factor glutamine methyltransferase
VSQDIPPPTPPSNDEWTVRKVLEWTTSHLKKHGSDTPRLDAEILLAHARGCKRIQLYTAYDESLTPAVRATMRDLVQRRAQAEPVAYLVGHREFFSLDFRVTKDVLIPRPDTETLVLEIIDGIKQFTATRTATDSGESPPPIRVLDLCTGSGCVAVAVAKHCQTGKQNVRITATDISRTALEIARENAVKHGVQEQIEFREGDLFAAVPTISRFEIIASNPPYVPTAEIDTLDPEVAKHEPRLALDGGASGFDVIDRLIATAPRHAEPGALFLMEFSPEQAEAAERRLTAAGLYADITVHRDLASRPRVLHARI